MQGLMKVLPPLAPDYSGASSVLFTLGGAIIINGADGCIGNVTGYDEPRFFDSHTCIYSSGLREVRAITGDEESLQEKIENSVGEQDVNFIVILGTPNSAVIASDHKGVASILRKGRNIPVFTITTTGIDTYEKGASQAFEQLARAFVPPAETPWTKSTEFSVNILGAIPMDFWGEEQIQAIRHSLETRGVQINSIWGMDNSLETIRRSRSAHMNLVISQSALKAARYLEKTFGMPYVTGVPVGRQFTDTLVNRMRGMHGERSADLPQKSEKSTTRALVIGDQIWTGSFRQYLGMEHGIDNVYTATFFALDKALKGSKDIIINSEQHARDLIREIQPDFIAADPLCRGFVSDDSVQFMDVPHLAVSSRIHWDHAILYTGDNVTLPF